MRVSGRDLSLRSLLIIATIAIVVPLSAISVLVVGRLAQWQEAALEDGVRQRVDAIATATERYFNDVDSVLRVVASGRSLQDGNLFEFRSNARSLVHAEPLTGGLGLFAEDGTLLEQVPGQAGPGFGAVPADWIRGVLRSGHPAVSDLIPAQNWRDASVLVAVPLQGAGRQEVLVTRIMADSLNAVVRTLHLPGDWIGALVDRRGHIVARTRDPAHTVGGPASPEFMENVRGSSGAFTTVNLERQQVYGAFRRLPETGWLSAIGMLRGPLLAPVRHSILSLAGAAVLALLIALGVAGWAVRRILGPLKALTRAARQIGRGEEPSIAPGGVRELNEIGSELVAAARQRNEAEAAHAQAEQQLRHRQQLEMIGQLAAGVAHDFNNLLMVIAGHLEMLERVGLPPRCLRHVSASMRAVERGDRLVRQVLSFGQRQMLQPRPCDIDAMLGDLLPLMQSALGAGIRVELVRGAGGAVCRIDAGEFERAVLNIVINARDAMDGQGSLTINTRLAAGQGGERQLVIGFRDSGPGMDPEILEHAFEPFFTTKEIGRGSGLGLSQVYGFVHQSGGHAALDSKPGEGTTVTLTLPVSDESATDREQKAERPADGVRGLTVLVVDDTPDVLDTVTAVLEAAGCSVLQASDAAEGLALVREHGDRIGVVLSDVMMPGGMLGTELKRRIPDVCPGLPTVLMSGYAEHQNDNDVLLKPFSTHDLLRVIRAAAAHSDAE